MIDTIIGMLIMMVAFYPLISTFMTILPKGSQSKQITEKFYLLQGKVEEAFSKSFSTFNGATVEVCAPPFARYTSRIAVNFVDPANLDRPVANPTNYKRVVVQVWDTGSPASSVEVIGIITTHVPSSTEAN